MRLARGGMCQAHAETHAAAISSTASVDVIGAAMGRRPIQRKALTPTQRQRRWRKRVAHNKAHAAAISHRAEVVHGLAEATAAAAARLAAMPLYNVLLIDG